MHDAKRSQCYNFAIKASKVIGKPIPNIHFLHTIDQTVYIFSLLADKDANDCFGYGELLELEYEPDFYRLDIEKGAQIRVPIDWKAGYPQRLVVHETPL